MERLAIDELIAHCDRKLAKMTSGNIFYQEHESVRAYLQILRHYVGIGTVEEFRAALLRTAEHVKAMEDGLTRGAELVRAESLIGKQLYVCWRGDTADQVCIRDISSVCITDDGKISLEDGPYDGFVCYMDEIGKWDYDKFVGLTRQEAETALERGGEDA